MCNYSSFIKVFALGCILSGFGNSSEAMVPIAEKEVRVNHTKGREEILRETITNIFNENETFKQRLSCCNADSFSKIVIDFLKNNANSEHSFDMFIEESSLLKLRVMLRYLFWDLDYFADSGKGTPNIVRGYIPSEMQVLLAHEITKNIGLEEAKKDIRVKTLSEIIGDLFKTNKKVSEIQLIDDISGEKYSYDGSSFTGELISFLVNSTCSEYSLHMFIKENDTEKLRNILYSLLRDVSKRFSDSNVVLYQIGQHVVSKFMEKIGGGKYEEEVSKFIKIIEEAKYKERIGLLIGITTNIWCEFTDCIVNSLKGDHRTSHVQREIFESMLDLFVSNLNAVCPPAYSKKIFDALFVGNSSTKITKNKTEIINLKFHIREVGRYCTDHIIYILENNNSNYYSIEKFTNENIQESLESVVYSLLIDSGYSSTVVEYIVDEFIKNMNFKHELSNETEKRTPETEN